MDVSIEQRGSVALVRMTGSVDGLTAEGLQTRLLGVAGQCSWMVADMSGVEYTSSAGLRALLATVKAARQNGGDFRLAAIQPGVLRVLDLSGFTSILKHYPDVDAAVASFGGAA